MCTENVFSLTAHTAKLSEAIRGHQMLWVTCSVYSEKHVSHVFPLRILVLNVGRVSYIAWLWSVTKKRIQSIVCIKTSSPLKLEVTSIKWINIATAFPVLKTQQRNHTVKFSFLFTCLFFCVVPMFLILKCLFTSLSYFCH